MPIIFHLFFSYFLLFTLGYCQSVEIYEQRTDHQYNLGFEESLQSNKNSWYPLLDDFKWERDTVDKVEGKSSYKFSRTYLATQFEMCMFQKILLPNPSKSIEVSIFSKSLLLEKAWMKIFGFNKNMELVSTDSVDIAKTSQWQKDLFLLTNKDSVIMISIEIRGRETFKTKKDVVRYWIDNLSIKTDGINFLLISEKPIMFSKAAIKDINCNIQLTDKLEITGENLSDIGKKKIVGFGETIHGSQVFHQAVFQNMQQIVSACNCRLILLEIPIETGLLLNQYINDNVISDYELNIILTGIALDKYAFINFLKWIKNFNKSVKDKVVLFGIDDYINKSSPKIISEYFRNKNSDSEILDTFLTLINTTYKRFKHLEFAENNSGKLISILGESDYLYLLQVLRIRTDSLCRISSTWHEWKFLHRDYLMWQNVKYAIENFTSLNSTVCLWGHFSHLNKNTPYLLSENNSLGQYIFESYGNGYYLIGILAGRGEVSTWEIGGKKRINVFLDNPPSQSLEFLCSLSDKDNFFKTISNSDLNSILLREIGSVFRKNSQFAPFDVKKSMDGFIFMRNSKAAEIPSVY